ncbi:MAG: two-component system response regulator [Armatimonadetes bacterium]|nr:two-component system response regulator [Armatimonadota bacterium]
MSAKRKRILVVDDEESIQQLLQAVLSKEGYEVSVAGDGDEALKLVDQNAYDLIVLDIVMPGKNGLEVLKHIKGTERLKFVPVIIMTALMDRDVRYHALDLGVDEFLNKPIDIYELRARVRTLLSVKEYHDFLASLADMLKDEVDKKTKELREAQLETVRRLGRAAEFRDDETGNHILRMSIYCAILARRLGLSDEEVEMILYASPMHDVGKIGVPDKILLKPGKLDPDEWEIMKKHTVWGAEILSGSKSQLLETARTIALTHHEKWDGSGYPYGLSGEEIPLFGRICAISDVFDALTSERVYKPAYPNEKAFAIITEGRGKHFDPKVVDAFFASLDEILEVQSKHAETAKPWLWQFYEDRR